MFFVENALDIAGERHAARIQAGIERVPALRADVGIGATVLAAAEEYGSVI
jgi:hypothetical protein